MSEKGSAEGQTFWRAETDRAPTSLYPNKNFYIRVLIHSRTNPSIFNVQDVSNLTPRTPSHLPEKQLKLQITPKFVSIS
jgi:hypothetical protein